MGKYAAVPTQGQSSGGGFRIKDSPFNVASRSELLALKQPIAHRQMADPAIQHNDSEHIH
jgi:hypothetical protein